MNLTPTSSSKLELPKSFTEFKEKLKTKNVLSSYQFQNYTIEFIHSINLEMCVKSLFFEIIHYQMRYESDAELQIPFENIFAKKDIDIDLIYQNFVNQSEILIQIDNCLSSFCVAPDNISPHNIYGPFLTLGKAYFWLVTFPNLFGSFISLESSLDAKNFIKHLFEVIFDETSNLDPSKKEIYLNHAILASISYISHNYLFYDTFQKAFFSELTNPLTQISSFENQFNSLKNALKTAALTFNQHQIQVLQIYFNSKQTMLNDDKIPIQYAAFLDRFIFLVIDEWEYSPYFQGNSFNLFKIELKKNKEKQIELMTSFEDVINQMDSSDYDDMVPFSQLLFSHRISKVLTDLDIIILNRIDQKDSTKIDAKKEDIFSYQVIECSPESFSTKKDSEASNTNSDFLKDSQILSHTLTTKFSSNNIQDESIAQWLKLTERIKYGSDYDDIISYHIKVLHRFNAYSESNYPMTKQTISDEIDTLIKLGNIEHDQDIETKDEILKNLKNFFSTIKMNSNALNEILIYSSSTWILSLKDQKNNLDRRKISGSFIKILKKFTENYVEFDENNYNSGIDCFDISEVHNKAQLDFLNLLIAEKKGPAPPSNKNLDSVYTKLENDEYRNEKGSSNNFYSLLLTLKKFRNDDLNNEIKRSIKYLYEIYIDYINRGFFFANKKIETITVLSDDQFRKIYNQDLDNLLLKNSTESIKERRKFNTILEEMLPFFSLLLKPMIYDIIENENTVKVCLVSFENAALLINNMLNLIVTPKLNKRLFSAFIALSSVKFIKKNLSRSDNQPNKKETSTKDEIPEEEHELDQFCEKKLISFYKLLAHQDAYNNYPELQKLRTFFFH